MEIERHRFGANSEIADAEEALLEDHSPQLFCQQLLCVRFREERRGRVARLNLDQLSWTGHALKLVEIKLAADRLQSEPARLAAVRGQLDLYEFERVPGP